MTKNGVPVLSENGTSTLATAWAFPISRTSTLWAVESPMAWDSSSEAHVRSSVFERKPGPK